MVETVSPNDATNGDEPLRLTEWTSCGGCAAKWGAAPLRALVADLAVSAATADLLVGLAPFDDAAIFRLSDDLALVSTTDFFPPLVDDPDDFGAIAAANACSDVFAMGGRVVLALNVAAFPERMPPTVIEQILRAAAAVVGEAGGVVAGGHTIRSEEPIFGLAVQGLVHPERVWTKAGARPGDAIVLSKPLGTGIVLAGGGDHDKRAAIARMRELNRYAAERLESLGEDAPHAVTDVTGFGLFGHAWEMAEGSSVRFEFDASALPFYAGALDAARRGTRTGGDARNRAALDGRVTIGDVVDDAIEAVAFDPQTSGGLLASVSERAATDLCGDGAFTLIGRVAAGQPHIVLA
jgi:selenide,water dikinase